MIVGLLTQETTTFKGRYYQLSDARNEPKPVQRPHPPICIGGSGERRTLRTAARFAQHWNFVGGTPEEFARKRDVLHQHCGAIGRDPDEILLSSHVLFAGDATATAARRRARRRRHAAGHRAHSTAPHGSRARTAGCRPLRAALIFQS